MYNYDDSKTIDNYESNDIYPKENKQDQLNKKGNAFHRKAIGLYERLLEDFTFEEFSLKEIQEAYHELIATGQNKKSYHGPRYGKKTMTYLIDLGLIEIYRVNKEGETLYLLSESPEREILQIKEDTYDIIDNY